jgi:hypothetical protein
LISEKELISLLHLLATKESGTLNEELRQLGKIVVFRRHPDDTVPQRGSCAFEVSALYDCRPHLASRSDKSSFPKRRASTDFTDY